MKRVYIKDLHDHIGAEVTVAGWVDVRRDQGKLIFIELRDMTGQIQTVSFAGNKEAHGVMETLRPEWVVEIKGSVNKRPEKTVNSDLETGDIEIEAKEIFVLSKAQELPFEKDAELNLDTHLDYLPLTLRTERSQNIFKLQATLIETFRSALREQFFIEFQAPEIVGSDAEGGANVFKVEYFNDKVAYLATSPQFYKQIMVGVFERVFTTPKAFRAEKHSTTRHLNEYATLDFEMGFIKDHRDVMAVLEGVVKHLIKTVSEKHANIFKLFDVEIPRIPDAIPVLKLREAQEIIKKETGEDCSKEPDLEPAHERFLCEYSRDTLNSDFLFITHYPVSKRPFYTHEDEGDTGYTKSFDLLFRGVEITTGGQRIHDHDTLVGKMKARGLDPEKFSYYLQAFKYGMPPHGGCATGLERLTQKFLNLENVKEATLFPREINRIDTLLSE